MSGKRSRTKGVRWENEVATTLQTWTNVEARRRGSRGEARYGNLGDIVTGLPLTVQCKVGARPNIYRAMEEAREAAVRVLIEESHITIPVAFTRKNAAHSSQQPEDLVTMRMPDFMLMFSVWWKLHGKDGEWMLDEYPKEVEP